VNYEDFLTKKRREWVGCGVDAQAITMPPHLFSFQEALTMWALRKGRAAVFADTGLGKTRVQLAWAANIPGRVLILAPLCVGQQTQVEALAIGLEVGHLASGASIEITNYERLHHVNVAAYAGIVLDECFIAGTPIDTPDGPRPIEEMRPGDGVINAIGYDRVVAVKERKLSRLVCLTLHDGTQLHCSEHHPFFSIRGLVSARMLKKGDYLYGTDEAMRVVQGDILSWPGPDVQAILQSLLLGEMADESTRDSRQGSCSRGRGTPRQEKERVAAFRRSEGQKGDGADQATQSEPSTRRVREDFRNASGDETSTECARREWSRSDRAATPSHGTAGFGMVHGVRNFTRPQEGWLPDLLQGRYRKPIFAAGGRDRWVYARQSQRSGCEERQMPSGAWVARVEILESRSPEFRALSGGEDSITLYDLQVDRHPSYSVHRLLVHNSSILKSYDGKTRTRLIRSFADTPYRLCCTATPAPNDIAELANHCEFLGIMTRTEMLATWFVHDENGWRLKGHAHEAFYRWLTSWGMFVRRPSDLGFDDDGYRLPPLDIQEHVVSVPGLTGEYLFPSLGLGGIRGRLYARRHSVKPRVDRVVQLVEGSAESWIIWCGLNDEQDQIVAALDGDCVSVAGQDSEQEKTARLNAFLNGETRVLVTKTRVAGFGLNLQHCANMAFLGLGDSYESYYQAIRRCYRFGQMRPVSVHIVVSDAEVGIVNNVWQKEAEASRMAEGLLNAVRDMERKEVGTMTRERATLQSGVSCGAAWTLHEGDSVDVLPTLPAASVDFSIYSPPFVALYTYTNSERDIGNCATRDEFLAHYAYVVREVLRTTKPGRLSAVHISQTTMQKARDGVIGLSDLRGAVIDLHAREGWIYHGEVCIDKDPQAQAIRTHSKALLFAQLRKDASWLRPALADYILVFRKPGDNAVPVQPDISNDDWIEWARPIWYGIRESDTLNVRAARGDDDDRHICPLQLGVIERCVRLWTNSNEVVLSPFAGIGSEGYESVRLGRRFIGIELKHEYAEAAQRNLTMVEREHGRQGALPL